MYIDPKARQILGYATPVNCNNNPQEVIAIDRDKDEHLLLTPKPIICASPCLLKQNNVNVRLAHILSLNKKLEYFPTLTQQLSDIVFYRRHVFLIHWNF